MERTSVWGRVDKEIAKRSNFGNRNFLDFFSKQGESLCLVSMESREESSLWEECEMD